MATVAEKLITAAEFEKLPEPLDGSKQELVRGVIHTRPPTGFEQGEIQGQLYFLILQYAKAHRLGRATVESGVCTEKDPDSVRGPDISFWGKDRIPLDQPAPKGYADVPPDLCVEVLSPSHRPGKLTEKLREYFAYGVRMVWVVDPEDRTVKVYRSADEGRVLHVNATLTGEDVLPGFECRVAEIFQ